ncbi:hypothetical protein C3747_54g111 [Trypanosoma cruzi]|uniref:Saccharopine dehydrogenase NADP binding domain-containing protein n=2 Tax=Trypanosoma cruzi TaxID=5693 RepID=A0A2V2WW94_TRYCR|nr:hypothetical protein ECC02_009748 [Trypanosoma cruzi]PWV12123.1 hypothetical protein C3747_54g111 [Trypanosoma cruzi]
MSREFSLIVLGATGYTGKLVCEYLARLGSSKVGPWAIAGRNKEKLDQLKKEIGVNLSVLVADITSPSSLDKLCASTSVLISCAGPFTYFGMPVVEACVRCQTHYVDSTGEYNFVRQVIEKFHEEAKKQRVALVSCCAFGSVPGDLGNYFVRQGLGSEVAEVKAFYQVARDGMSGGTAHSVMAVHESCGLEDNDPYSLLPKDAPRPPTAPARRGVWYDFSERRLTGPSSMSDTNERIVRRTNALLGYGGTYVEAIEGTLGAVVGATITKYMMTAVLAVPFLRRYVAENWLPPAGTGPTQSQREGLCYKCNFVATDKSGKVLRRVFLSDTRDVYTASGIYVAECALSALQMAKEGTLGFGVLTPISAFGDVLLQRVRSAGVVVEAVEEATTGTATPTQ